MCVCAWQLRGIEQQSLAELQQQDPLAQASKWQAKDVDEDFLGTAELDETVERMRRQQPDKVSNQHRESCVFPVPVYAPAAVPVPMSDWSLA